MNSVSTAKLRIQRNKRYSNATDGMPRSCKSLLENGYDVSQICFGSNVRKCRDTNQVVCGWRVSVEANFIGLCKSISQLLEEIRLFSNVIIFRRKFAVEA